MAFAFLIGLLPNPWLTPDILRMQTVDTTMPAGELGLSDLGVSESVPMEDRADRYLMRFRKISQFVEEREVVHVLGHLRLALVRAQARVPARADR